MNDIEIKVKEKRDCIKRYLATTAIKSNKHALDKFLFSRWSIPFLLEKRKNKKAPPTPLMAALDWLNDDFSNMEWPILHIIGEKGTGKSHFARGLIRYILLNRFEFTQDTPTTVECVDWHEYLGNLKQSFGKKEEVAPEIDWMADIMLIEDIDRSHTTKYDGTTYNIDTLLSPLKKRLELDRLPTIIITYRNVLDLLDFLAQDSKGVIHKSAKPIATEIATLIGYSKYVGVSRGTDFRMEIIKNKDYGRLSIEPGLETQNLAQILGQNDCFGSPLEW